MIESVLPGWSTEEIDTPVPVIDLNKADRTAGPLESICVTGK